MDNQFLFPSTAFNAELHHQKVLDMLIEHDNRDDLCREKPELNHLDGSLTGQQVMYLQAKPEALLKFFKQVGCAYDTIGTTDKGEKVPHYTPKDINDKVLLLQVLRHSCARYINNELKHRFLHQRLVGIQYYCDTPTPEAHLLYEFSTENTTTTYPTLNPINLPTVKTKNTEEAEEDIDSPLSSSAYSLGNQRRLIQRQQQAINDHDDKEPEIPTPKKQQRIVDETLQRQRQRQAEQQQADAIDDNENDKKKRDHRRQQRQRRTKQRLTQEQQAEEARIIRERCLADEAKRDAELKHPSTRKHGSRPSVNNHAHNHKHEGPEPF